MPSRARSAAPTSHTLFCCTSATHGEPEKSRAERTARVETETVSVPAPQG